MRRLVVLATTGLLAAATIFVAAPVAQADTCQPDPPMPAFNSVYTDENGTHVVYGEVPNDALALSWWASQYVLNYIDCNVTPILPLDAVLCLKSKNPVTVETKPTPHVSNRYVQVGTEELTINFPLLQQDIADCTPLD